KVWFDEWSIKPGDPIFLMIEKGLEKSRTLILCLSPAALEADWVALERSAALFRDPQNGKRRFVPILLRDCSLPDTIAQYKYIDFRSSSTKALKALLEACGFNDRPSLTGKRHPLRRKKRSEPRKGRMSDESRGAGISRTTLEGIEWAASWSATMPPVPVRD